MKWNKFLITMCINFYPAVMSQDTPLTADEKPKEKNFRLPANEITVSQEESRKICAQYNNKFISYYSDVFKVENCKRYKLQAEQVYQVTRKKNVIQAVEAKVMVGLIEGGEWNVASAKKNDNCAGIEGSFVSSPYGQVYFIDKCRRRGFTYWADYETHRDSLPKSKRKITPLNDADFYAIKEGPKMPEVSSKDYWDGFGDESVDVIPLDEACFGIEGKYVAYYSEIYKIEKCRKRGLDRDDKKKIRLSKKKLRELTSQQWISLPDGKPL